MAEKKELKFKGPWRVVAVQQGQYNQFFMEIGMVFDLLTYEDGTYPVATRFVIKKDDSGAPLKGHDDKDRFIAENWDVVPVIGKDGVAVHRDFALDMGAKPIKAGPRKGEVIRVGWLKRVPATTPLGLYPVDENGIIQAQFWDQRAQLPQPMDAGYHPWTPGPLDRKRNHAPMLAFYPKPETEFDDGQDEEAA
jgi:hypothetical protein